MKRKFNLCTLKPDSEDDFKKFRDFRVDDIVEMYSIYIVVDLIFYVLMLVAFFAGNDRPIASCAAQTLTIVLNFFAWATRRRFQSRLMWTIYFLYMFTLLIQLFDYSYFFSTFEGETFSVVLFALGLQHFFQVWFLSPSFSFVLMKECLFTILVILF